MAEIDLTLNGLVISELRLNDHDKLLTLLTDKKGKMTVLAKHLNSPESKLSAGANLFCYSEYSFRAKNGTFWPVEASVINNFQNIANDVESVALASYFAEVASNVCMQENDESLLLKLMLNSLYAIANTNKPRWMIKAAFEMQAMRCLGFMPNFDNCCHCNAELPENPRGNIVFETVQGGFVCEKCAAKEGFTISNNAVSLSPAEFASIKFVSYTNSKKMLQFNVEKSHVGQFLKACEFYLIVQTENKYKTLEYYNKNFSK